MKLEIFYSVCYSLCDSDVIEEYSDSDAKYSLHGAGVSIEPTISFTVTVMFSFPLRCQQRASILIWSSTLFYKGFSLCFNIVFFSLTIVTNFEIVDHASLWNSLMIWFIIYLSCLQFIHTRLFPEPNLSMTLYKY